MEKNSDGGIIIWGAPKGKNIADQDEKVFTSELVPVLQKIEPDQFTNKISSEISPLPHKVLFHPIKIAEDSYCYIIDVQKREFSPHQFNGAFYIRMDGSTRRLNKKEKRKSDCHRIRLRRRRKAKLSPIP